MDNSSFNKVYSNYTPNISIRSKLQKYTHELKKNAIQYSDIRNFKLELDRFEFYLLQLELKEKIELDKDKSFLFNSIDIHVIDYG